MEKINRRKFFVFTSLLAFVPFLFGDKKVSRSKDIRKPRAIPQKFLASPNGLIRFGNMFVMQVKSIDGWEKPGTLVFSENGDPLGVSFCGVGEGNYCFLQLINGAEVTEKIKLGLVGASVINVGGCVTVEHGRMDYTVKGRVNEGYLDIDGSSDYKNNPFKKSLSYGR